ncbi:hypothetical protein FNF27_08145 [Cafeteria roenbergensis]|uniref:IPT/TIG domain-containing protein n=3 Tax=Cafeteria roenbergensis TaxID=33653 RepID=A0A5A8DCM5_CAFRO|nr:hypothetical protein FNF27_08145 [Cafeteria roenbergensis]
MIAGLFLGLAWLASSARGANPVRTLISTSSNKKDVFDLRDKFGSSFSRTSWSSSAWDDVSWSKTSSSACDDKRIGIAFQFNDEMIVHEVVIQWYPDSGTSDHYDDNRAIQVRVGNNMGFNDRQFGNSAYDDCPGTSGWQDTGGKWTVRHSTLNQAGKYISFVAKSDDCDCDDRRARALGSANASEFGMTSTHGRRLAFYCGQRDCAKLAITDAWAYQYSCPAGTYPSDVHSVANGNCVQCESGYWCPGGVLGMSASTYKNSCPSGKIGLGSGKSSQDEACGGCPAGQVITGSSCAACASGSYCPEDTQTEFDCPAAFYCPTPASKVACGGTSLCPLRSTAEQDCPAGYTCSQGLKAQCPQGFFCPAGQGTASPCEQGHFCPAGAASQTACSVGELCPAQSASAQQCPTGKYCSAGLATACPAGTFREATGAAEVTDCESCPAGTFGATSGGSSAAQACSQCASGSWSLARTTSCYPRLLRVEAADTDGVETGFSVLDIVTLTFGTPVASPEQPGATGQQLQLPPVGATATSVHGTGVYSAIVFWSRSLSDPGRVFCSSGDAAVIAAVASLAGVSASAVTGSVALLGDGATQLGAEWTTALTLRIEVRDPKNVDPDLVDVDASLLNAFPAPGRIGGQLVPANANAEAGANSVVVGGSWGVAGPPALSSVILRDTGRAEGFGPGDSMELQFNQVLGGKSLAAVAQASGASSVARAIVELWPAGATEPLDGWEGDAQWATRESVSPDARLVGAGDVPSQNTSAIVVTFSAAPDAAALSPAATAALMGGFLSVRVLTAADLRGIPPMHVLPPANNSVLSKGSWGELPATPVFRSHSEASAVLSWREPHRPQGTLRVSVWVGLGLQGFVATWCDAGPMDESLSGADAGRDMVAVARAAYPAGLGNASVAQALGASGACAAAFVELPATDAELAREITLPLLRTSTARLDPSRWFLVGVAAVFNGIVGPFAPAVDATPMPLARASLGHGKQPSGEAELPSTECVVLDWASHGGNGAAAACAPSSVALTPQQRRACRCRLRGGGVGGGGGGGGGGGNDVPGAMGVAGGSALLSTVAMSVDGVFTTSELGTAGGEFFSVIGDGLPISTAGAALSADHEQALRPQLAAAMAALATREASLDGLWNAPPAATREAVVTARAAGAGSPLTPYLAVSYGGGTGGKTYEAVVDECSVVTEGHVLRCLSLPGVGRGHSVNISVNGFGMRAPARAALEVSGDLVTWYGAVAKATLSYAAPYIQSFSYEASDGLPTEGGTLVTLTGRHFGPAGASHVDSVRFTPSRHNAFEFVAVNCTVSVAHVAMQCVAPPNAGDRAYWNATVASQESLLPSTSSAPPGITELQLVTRAMLASGAGSNEGLRSAVLRVLGRASSAPPANSSGGQGSESPPAANSTLPSNASAGSGDAVLDAFDAATGTDAASLMELPTSGGSLVLIRGHDFGPDMSFIARVWAVRPDGVLKQLFSQDVDEARRGTLATTPTGCAMAAQHTALVCRTLPGAGRGYFWRVQVLDQSSEAAPVATSYADVIIDEMLPSDIPSEGGTVVVKARNLPPENDDLVLRLGFNGGNISRITRSITSPLTEFEFVAPPVVVSRVIDPAGSNGSSAAASDEAVLVPVTLSVADRTAAAFLPIALPQVELFDADSLKRRPSALDVDTPPAEAGGRDAILLEVYGSSFGGSIDGMRLTLDGELCIPLTLRQIELHLSLPSAFDPHRQFFCWTSKRQGKPALIDVAAREAIGSPNYDFDAIKTPPTLTSVVVVNASTDVQVATGTELDTMGGQLLRVSGAALAAVTSLELIVLAPAAFPSQPPSERTPLFVSPCEMVPRRDVAESTGEDPCPWIGGRIDDLPAFCATDRALWCRSTVGIGGSLFVRAVSASAAAEVSGWSASAIAGFRQPVMHSVAPATLATTGGDTLQVSGAFFGSADLPQGGASAGTLDAPAVLVGGRPCPLLSRNDSFLACVSPPGVRGQEAVTVTVQGQAALASGGAAQGEAGLLVAYRPPVVERVRGFELEGASGPAPTATQETVPGRLELSTRGGWLQVVGRDFGASPSVSLEDTATGVAIACAADDSVRPAATPGHNETWCRVAPGDGTSYRVVLSTGAASLGGRTAVAPMRFGFRRPRIVAVYFDTLDATAPQTAALTLNRDASLSSAGRAPTGGGFVLHVVGDSFSASARVVVGGLACNVIAGVVRAGAPLGLGEVVELGDGVRGAAYLPVDLDTSGLKVPGASFTVRPPVAVTSPPGEERRWVTHELVSCAAPAGSGAVNLTVFSSSQQSSQPVRVRYDPPSVASIAPPYARANLPDAATAPDLRLGEVSRFEPLCGTTLMSSPNREILCSPAVNTFVGLLLVQVTVNGQQAQERALLTLCPVNFFGGPGETCKQCPEGAFCAGGFSEPQPLPGYFKRAPSSFLACNPTIACRGADAAGIPRAEFPFQDLTVGHWQQQSVGVNVTLEPTFAEARQSGNGDAAPSASSTPRALVRRRALAGASNEPTAAAESQATATEELRLGSWNEAAGAKSLPLHAVFPANGSLSMLLDRYRLEASTALNSQCLQGYRGVRCAACADRFYRLEGRCEPCPELAWLMIPGFILGLLALLGVASFLQKKNVQLAGLSVGVDMMQILSVFAALDLSWPVEIRTVWTTVSMTTFSIQILAPECSVKLEYADKFFAVAAIPPVLAAGCLAIVAFELGRRFTKRWRRASKAAAQSASEPSRTAAETPSCWTAAVACLTCSRGSSVSQSRGGDDARLPLSGPPSLIPQPGGLQVSGGSHASVVARMAAASGRAQEGSLAAVARATGTAEDDADDGDPTKPASAVAASAIDSGLGLALTLLYFAYLTATRNALQPMDCTVVEAADGSGSQKVMKLEPSVVCDVSSDKTYAQVLPWAVITLLLYGLGIPLLFAVMLFTSRKAIVADQKLLAVGEGHVRATNPNFSTRKRLGRLYADYKPEVYWWRLVLTARKALVATVSILFTGTPVFAASATALILFVSFLMHSRYQPFLHAPPVSKAFMALADELDDGAAAAAAQAMEAQARQEAREAARAAKESSLSFVFDYNTLEGSFLITGVLVLMGGLAFSSNAIKPGSVAYVIVVAAIVLLVVGALGSFVWILGFELYRSLRFADVLTKARMFQDSVLAKSVRAKRTASVLARFAGESASSKAAAKLRAVVRARANSRQLEKSQPIQPGTSSALTSSPPLSSRAMEPRGKQSRSVPDLSPTRSRGNPLAMRDSFERRRQ